jgi:hypothetical protein
MRQHGAVNASKLKAVLLSKTVLCAVCYPSVLQLTDTSTTLMATVQMAEWLQSMQQAATPQIGSHRPSFVAAC